MNPYQQIRQQSLMGGYDQLTPEMYMDNGGGGGMGYNDDPFMAPPPSPGLTSVADQQQSGYGLGTEPEVQPELPFTPRAPTVQNPYGNQTPPYDPNESVKRTMDLVNQVYTPATKSRDRFDTLLDAFPERYTPNKSDRFSAVLMGLGAGGRQGGNPLDTMDRVLQAPYIRDVEEWKTKSDPFGKAAQFENTANANERQLAGNVVTAQIQADRLAENARQADQKNEVAMTRNRIAQAKAAGLRVEQDGDRWVGFEPNGTMHVLGSSRGMTEQDTIDAKGRWAERAADARAATAVAIANTQAGTTYEEVQADGSKKYFIIGRDGIRKPVVETGSAPAGPGTTVPMTAPGTPPARPTATTPTGGKPVVVPKSSTFGKVDGAGDPTAKVLTPTQQRVETSNKIAGILSRHTNWNQFVNYNPDTKLYEGMGKEPQVPRTAGWFGIGGGGASDEEWQQYKDDMDGYNYLRSILHPEMPPLKVYGGSNAEQKAQRAKQSTTTSTIPPTTSTVSPTKGIGPSGSSTSTSPTSTSTIGPTNAPNNPKSLPGSGSTSTASTTTTTIPQTEKKSNTWMPSTGDNKFAFLPDSWNKYLNRSYEEPTTPVKPGSPADMLRKEQKRQSTTTISPTSSNRKPYPDYNTTNAKKYGQKEERPTSVFPNLKDEPRELPREVSGAIPPNARTVSDGRNYAYTTDNGKTWVKWDWDRNEWIGANAVKSGGRKY